MKRLRSAMSLPAMSAEPIRQSWKIWQTGVTHTMKSKFLASASSSATSSRPHVPHQPGPRMTLEQLEQSLPNGLHDAQIRRVEMDYEHARLVLRVKVWVGLLDQPPPERDRYRDGNIVFEGVQLFSIELPQPGSAFRHPGSVWFSYERTTPGVVPATVADGLRAGTQSYSLFVQDWLSCIQIATSEVGFSWSEEDIRKT